MTVGQSPEDKEREPGRVPRLAPADLDLLCMALLATAGAVFIVGNLLLLDAAVWWSSARVSAVCLGLLCMSAALAKRLGHPLWALLLCYGFLWVLLRLPVPVAQGAFLVGVGVAGAWLARTLRVDGRHWIGLCLMALFAAVVVLGVERAFTSFDMLSRLHAGLVRQDTLHHASIAAMIKQYGIVSTGLHGLVATPYHAFSHQMVGAISLLSGISVIEAYGVVPWVLFAPLLVFAMCVASLAVAVDKSPPVAIVWLLVGLVLALAPRLLQPWGVFDAYFNSESYLVALGLFLLALPTLLKRDLELVDLLLVSLVAVILANSKSTVGLIYAGLWFVRLVFHRGAHARRDLLAALLTGFLVAVSVLGAARANSEYYVFRAFDYVGHYTWLGSQLRDAQAQWAAGGLGPGSALIAASAIVSFLLLHFLPAWIAVLPVLRRAGWRGVLSDPMATQVCAVVVVGVIAASVLHSPGAAVFYITNIAFMLALPVVLARGAERWQGRERASTLLLLPALAVLVWTSFDALLRISAWRRPSVPQHNALVEQLLEMRVTAPLAGVYVASDAMLASNPVANCAARPFLFPALSERAWVRVIQSHDPDCRFGFYGYASYGITPGQPWVRVEPRLLPGMAIVDPPPRPGAAAPAGD